MNSKELFERSKKVAPGGVHSPVRSFAGMGREPVFFKSAQGAHLWSVEGTRYIDFCQSFGPLVLGHRDPEIEAEVREMIGTAWSFGACEPYSLELAEWMTARIPWVEKVRFVSSGTEAVMSALRVARAVTGREKILKFEGCYHGHVDSLLVKAGSGLVTFGNSSSAGIPESFVNETIVVSLNNLAAVKSAFAEFKNEIACVIIEPIPANNGLLLQTDEFLKELRTVCSAEGTLLIFDEVISGFRVGFTGAAGYYGIQPDICTYGKIIGGGLPVGAYGASAEIMSNISPEGKVYQAGTLSGNPVAMSAGIAQLTECLKPNFYEQLKTKTDAFIREVCDYAKSKSYDFSMYSIGSIFWIAFSKAEAIRSADEIDATGMDKFRVFYHELLKRGVYLGPSGYEVGFVSEAHSQDDLSKAAKHFCAALDLVFSTKSAN